MCAAAAVLGLFTAVVCSGCGFSSNQARPPDGSVGDDGGPDVPIVDASDGPPPMDGCVSFSRRVDTCRFALTADVTLTGPAVYNTDTHELRVDGQLVAVAHATFHTIATQDDPGNDVEAILARDVTIRSGVRLRAEGNQPAGTMPLAIIASGKVSLEDNAMIDVADGGAGAIPACSTAPMAGQDSNLGAGGGGGGAYGNGGGKGGNGNGLAMQVPGGEGGGSVAMPPGLRGGCPGARGGTGSGGAVAAGGNGGGAIFIAAGVEIRLGSSAIVHAGGGGGRGGPQNNGDIGNAGGGGGGSGGMIVLEAPRVLAMAARITANGGGGGEGSSGSQSGNAGSPGSTTTAAAAGGNGGATDGTDGGQGGARSTTAGQSVIVALARGGGGGGGAVGYIHIVSPDAQLGPNVSPQAIVQP